MDYKILFLSRAPVQTDVCVCVWFMLEFMYFKFLVVAFTFL